MCSGVSAARRSSCPQTPRRALPGLAASCASTPGPGRNVCVCACVCGYVENRLGKTISVHAHKQAHTRTHRHTHTTRPTRQNTTRHYTTGHDTHTHTHTHTHWARMHALGGMHRHTGTHRHTPKTPTPIPTCTFACKRRHTHICTHTTRSRWWCGWP